MVVFPTFNDIIVCVDIRFLFLTLDLSSVVVPFYLHIDLLIYHLFLPGPGTAGRNMLATKAPTHTCLLSCCFHHYIHNLVGLI